MKKIIVLAALIFGFSIAASAQPRAIGLRVGTSGEISYQHSMGLNFIEVNAGLNMNALEEMTSGLVATGIYNFMIAQPQWTDRGEWGFYAGPGAAIGLEVGEVNSFVVGAAGMAGLEYTFWFPLQLSVDYRMHLGFRTGENPIWAAPHMALTARYRF